jgi:hypothetical protein
LDGGEHLTHMKMALRPIKMLMVAMITQSNSRMRPDIRRRRVRANEVLLQTAARMEKVPVKLPMKPILDMFSGGTS